jgi:hypothetical protein
MRNLLIFDRRFNSDRRVQDGGHWPIHEEQRVKPERRLPEVEHFEFSEHVEMPLGSELLSLDQVLSRKYGHN